MSTRRSLGLLFGALLFLGACSGGDSKDAKAAKSIMAAVNASGETTITREQADCVVVELLKDNKYSLDELVSEDNEPDQADAEAAAAALATCSG